MTTVTWLARAGGNWNDAGDWSTGTVPGAADDVLLAAGSATVTHTTGSNSVHSIDATTDLLAVSGGTLSVLASSSLAQGLTLTGGAFVVAGGTTQVDGRFSGLGGVVELAGGAELRLGGSNTFGDSSQNGPEIDGPGTLLTSGSTSVSSDGRYFTIGDGAVWVNTGTVTDSGVVTLGVTTGPTGFIRNMAGAEFNIVGPFGSVQVGMHQNATGVEVPDPGVFTNYGLLTDSVSSFGAMQARLVNRGTIDVLSGASFGLMGGGLIGGTIEGGGTLSLSNGVFVLDHPLVEAGTGFILAGGTVEIKARTHVSGITLAGGTFDGPGTFDNTGSVVVEGWLGGGVRVANFGTMVLAGLSVGDLSGATATIVNRAGATVQLFTNSALVDDVIYNPQTGQVSYGSSVFRNAGTIQLVGTLSDGATGAELASWLANTGTIELDGLPLGLGGGGSLGGVIEGPGTLWLGGGDYTFAGLRVRGGASLSLDFGATATLTAGETLENLVPIGGTVDGPGTLIEPGTITGNLSATLGGGVTFINTGVFAGVGDFLIGLSVTDTATIVNAAGATFSMSAFDIYPGPLSYGRGLFRNLGTLVLSSQSGSVSALQSTFDNVGTIDTSAGELLLSGGGNIGGSLIGDGSIELGSGDYTFTGLSQGSDASIVLDGGTIEVPAGATLPRFTLLFGELDGAIRYVLSGPQGPESLTVGGGFDLVNSGSLYELGYIGIGDSVGRAVFDNVGAATLELGPGTSIVGTDGTLDNAGALIADSPGYGNTISTAVVNTGLIDARAGLLSFTDSITGSGSIDIEAGATLGATGISDGQTITFGGAGATLRLYTLQGISTPVEGLSNASIAFTLPTYADELATTAAIDGSVLTITPGGGGAALRFISATSLAHDTVQVGVGPDGVTVTVAPSGDSLAASGSAASLDGQTVAEFGVGESIDVTDLAFASLQWAKSGNRLQVSDGAQHADLFLPANVGAGNLLFRADAGGGTEIAFAAHS